MESLDDLLELDKSKGIYIDIGTKLYLEIEGVNFSVTSVFVGLLKDEFMIITLPKRYKSVKTKLYKGNKIVIKYLFEGSVYAFQSNVIEIITDPIKAVAIEYPKIVQERELRLVKRNSVTIPGRIEYREVGFSIVVFDISKNGCRFKYNDDKPAISPLKEGDFLKIFCQFPGVSTEVAAIASVRNVKREKEKLSIGTQFHELTDSFLTPLMHFLYAIEDFS
ncbi:MAG: flagellar brake protein [Desulfobacteraceae bacterium]|mgnify:CR=1 FL=1|nr:MAG: flagellar brake protein [Desulfobacteraceae bacterium]